MTRAIMVLFAAGAIAATCTLNGHELPNFAPDGAPAHTVRDKVERATVRVVTPGVICAGVLLTGNLVATAEHCVQGIQPGRSVRVETRSGTTLGAKLLRADPDVDLALLAVEGRGSDAALAWPEPNSRVGQGDRVLVAGHPERVGWCVALGSAEAEQRIQGVRVALQGIRVTTWQGMSGGPVVSQDGSLVGIIVRCDGDHRRGWAVPGRIVRQFIDETVRSAPATNVIVYSTTWCPSCTAVKAYLSVHGVPFEERSADDPAVWQALVAWAAQRGVRVEGIPVIVIGDSIITGFNKAALDQALRSAGLLVGAR